MKIQLLIRLLVCQLALLPAWLHAQSTPAVRKLHAANKFPQAQPVFGMSAAMGERWIVVGEPRHHDGTVQAGAAHVFNAATGAPVRRLLCPDPKANAFFGSAVAVCGDHALIGAPLAGNAGLAYLFNMRTGRLLRTLPAPSIHNARFGTSVALCGDSAAVGDVNFTSAAGKTGGVFYYASLSQGAPPSTLVPADAMLDDDWGRGVALEGGLLLGGAPGHDNNSGAAYLYEAAAGMMLHKLAGAASDRLGASVAMAGGRLAVGAPGFNGSGNGKARLYLAETGGWLGDMTAEDGAAGHLLGFSLAASHDLIVAGAPGHAILGGGTMAGAAYVFDSRTGKQLRRLLIPGRQKDHWGGVTVAVCGSSVLVGAPFAGDQGTMTGHAAVFSGVSAALAMTPLAASGDAAPGLAGARHGGFGGAVIDPLGRAAFTSALTGAGAGAGRIQGSFSAMTFPESADLALTTGQNLAPWMMNGVFVRRFGAPLISSFSRAYFPARLGGAGVTRDNEQLIVADDGSNAYPLFRCGSMLPGLGLVNRLEQTLVHPSSSFLTLNYRARQGMAGIHPGNDSGLIGLTVQTGEVHSSLTEGATLNNGLSLGQIQSASASQLRASMRAGIVGDPVARQGVVNFVYSNGNYGVVSKQGAVAPDAAGAFNTGRQFRSYFSQSINSDNWVMFRASLNGTGVGSANREGLWMWQGFVFFEAARLGGQVPGMDNGVVWSRFLQHWLLKGKQALVLGRVRGPGVTAANDLVLWLRQEDGSHQILLREGDLLPGCDGARVGVIQRVAAETEIGAYSVQVSLRGARARNNQALLTGRTLATILDHDLLRQPHARLRKGSLMTVEEGAPARLASLRWNSAIQDRSGAGANGLGNVINETYQMALETRWNNGTRTVVTGRP